MQPEAEGFQAQYRDGQMVLRKITANSPAAVAGLMPGDRIVSANSQPVGTDVEWLAFRFNMEINRPLQLEIERQGKELRTELTPKRRLWTNSEVGSRVLSLGWQGAQLFGLALAFIIAVSRPRDPVALLGALMLAMGAIYPFDLPRGRGAVWRELPSALGILLWIPYSTAVTAGAIIFTFFATFPRRLFHPRWGWALVWLPSLFAGAMALLATARLVYHPQRLAGLYMVWPWRDNVIVNVACLIAGAIALILNYLALEDVNARRRVRVLVLGATTGLLALLPIVAIPRTNPLFLGVPSQIALLLVFLAWPLSFAYAILHDRMFDIRLMVRRGLQYALARGVVLSLVPGIAAILLVDLVFHGNQPLLTILRARGWIYCIASVLALLAYSRRKPWLEALDRRFFREHYDAQRLLRGVVEEVREAGSFDGFAPRVVARIEAALHPEFVALVARSPGEPACRAIASAPAGQVPPPLPADAKILSLVRVLGKPLDIASAESGWLNEQLPQNETNLVRQARIELLIPISTNPERREALLVMGFKRSEEPYSQEDRDFLVAIATSVALLLERPTPTHPRPTDAFEECPQCGTCYDSGAERCAREGVSLITISLPRALVGRYQLNQRRGRGGMGTVYEAIDTALDRHIAVKVIRQDLLGSAVAAERFRQEARAAASFTHPNVVTVYDFGVAANGRAFLVMELLEGTTLREEIRKQGRLTASRTLEVLRDVCAAVEAGHRRQLVHRDLKPENIFLAHADTGDTAKVLDFGLAKLLSGSQQTLDTSTGALVGTLHYMAPEQLRGQPADPAWDLWAVSVITYEMLTGVHPFACSTTAECYLSISTGNFSSVKKHLPDSPKCWEDFFARAFALDTGKRTKPMRILFSEMERVFS